MEPTSERNTDHGGLLVVFRHRRRGDLHGQSDGRAGCAEDGLPRAESARTGGAIDLQVRHDGRHGHLHTHRGTTVGVDVAVSTKVPVHIIIFEMLSRFSCLFHTK